VATPGMQPSHPVPVDPQQDHGEGLDPDEAADRLRRFGPNELPPRRRDPLGMRFIRQLLEPMAVLLIAAAGVAGLGLKERTDALAILAIVLLNALIGVIQEGKAAHALEALRTMETPTSRVRRGGTTIVVRSSTVVPGDVVLLAAGDRAPADLRLIRGATLEVDESLLTGESLPVAKSVESAWSAHAGTLVTRGSGEGVVLATGANTELGRIARHLEERPPATPLQVELRKLAVRLGAASIVIAAGVFVLILVRMGVGREGIQQAFLSAVALAVAAVPEGLATVVTVALALGVRRMAAHGAIVRRLPAVETLGSTTVIATDKTGTLTENRMSLEGILVTGSALARPANLSPAAMEQATQVAVLCNDATLDPPSGDPIEVALLGIAPGRVDELRSALPRMSTLPFDPGRRRMATLHKADNGVLLLEKGAPEEIITRCSEAVTASGETHRLDPSDRRELLRAAEKIAGRGARVLALAQRTLAELPDDVETAEHDMTLIALAGLRDPVRSEAAAAVAEARAAGIIIVMVTGDHAATAAAISDEVGLAEPGSRILTGSDLGRGLPEDPATVPVYARVTPSQKLDLVEGLQAARHVVAVTGDGVNDAPALRRADIGVAMGRSGSDVAREAADMVVTDDNLATIVEAVREGRGIYDNIRKVVDYLVAGNLSEITVVVTGLLLFPALGVPLLPLQLLWINLLTDGLPAIALGVDPVDPTLMSRPPRPRSERLLSARRLAFLFARGLIIAGVSVGSLAVARYAWHEPWAHARALMFTVLVTAHLLYAFAARQPSRGILGNRWLLAAVAGGILLQAVVVAWPAAHQVFGTARLTLREWLLVAFGGTLPLLLMSVWPTQIRRKPGPAIRRSRAVGP
jgi:Ca2+-transporting ATPase